MKCEICHLQPASRSIRRRIDGENREVFVCDQCARSVPAQKSSPTSLTDILFNLGLPGIEIGGRIDDAVCPGCGLSRGDLRAGRRMGCPRCYEIFKNDIRAFVIPPPFASAVRDSAHRDRAPVSRADGELEKALKKAIADERYEDAAKICERLRAKNPQNAGANIGKRGRDVG
ncbi:MAG: hypothetical protein FWG05_01255 [Kiritimatiellaeota bacterium]|nr:hypothetical protein [Kiritimatiellota bacterium]